MRLALSRILKSNPMLITAAAVTLAALAMPISVQAEGGFWRVDQIPNNGELAKATTSVFTVITSAGRWKLFEPAQFRTAQEALNSFADHSSLHPFELQLRVAELAKCYRSKAKVCKMRDTFEWGTAFLAIDQSTLFTALHVLKNKVTKANSNVADFVLIDQNGEKIFDTSAGDSARLRYVADQERDGEKVKSPFFDFVGLKLSRPIKDRTPLKIGDDRNLKPGDRLYSIGYPGSTYDRAKVLGKPDSNGVGLFVTYGPMVASPEAIALTGIDPKTQDPKWMELIDRAVLYAYADGYPGQSGSPVFNEHGEVVGIHIGGYPINGSASPTRTSTSVRTSWIKAVTQTKN